MDVSAIVTRLHTVTSLGQVVTADPAGSPINYDSSATLYSLLNSLVSQRMYPVTQREDPVQPSIIYQLIGSAQGNYDGQVTVSNGGGTGEGMLRTGLSLDHVAVLEGFDCVGGQQSVAPEIDHDLVRGDWHGAGVSVVLEENGRTV